MTLYNWLYVSISTFSLIVSLSVAYLAYFQSAKPKLLVGSNLIVFNSFVNTISGMVWGGITFVLPVTFYNWSPRGGSIYQVRLVIGQENNPQEYFDLAWTSFTKFIDGLTWEDEDVAQPIAVPGKDSVSKFIRFDWSPLTKEKLHLKQGQYELILFVWLSNSDKPEICEKFSFSLTEEIYQEFQKTVANDESLGIWISIDNSRRINNVMTKAGIEREYGN